MSKPIREVKCCKERATNCPVIKVFSDRVEIHDDHGNHIRIEGDDMFPLSMGLDEAMDALDEIV